MITNKHHIDNPWLPWVLDPVLLDEQKGRWRWYWVFLILTIGSLAYVYIAPALVIWMEHVSVTTDTTDQFDTYSAETHDIFLKNNIYSFIFPALGGIFLILLSTSSLSLHRNRITTGLTYNIPVSWTPFWKASFALALLFSINIAYLFWLQRDNISVSELTSSFLLWFALGLFVLLIQALGEELMFRGYLLRVLGALFPIRIIAVLLVMIVFFYQHVVHENTSRELLTAVIFFATSELVYFWILFRTRSLMATWGLRWINNIFFMLIISVAVSRDNSFTLFKYSFSYAKVEGSYFEDPLTYLLQITSVIIFVILIIWDRSPFHLAAASTETRDTPGNTVRINPGR
ncbi:MAG: lysostaphin resistance A-like protein [Methyloligellaceae bacterium]